MEPKGTTYRRGLLVNPSWQRSGGVVSAARVGIQTSNSLGSTGVVGPLSTMAIEADAR